MRTTTTALTLTLALALAACAGPDDAGEADSDARAAADAEGVPSEVDPAALEQWDVRLDDPGASEGDFVMLVEDDGFDIRTGPAGITWRPADRVESGDFTASATFTEQEAAPGHREAFGLLVGGFHLSSPDQKYTYFLVRGTGEYLIKQRSGDQTRTLVDWTSSDAVNAIGADGDEPTNTLAVRVAGDQVEFVVNDRVVETLPSDRVEPYGVVGIRVNHRLDLEVTDFAVQGGAMGDGA